MNTQNIKNTQNRQKYWTNVFYLTIYFVDHCFFLAVFCLYVYSITCKFD